MSTHKMKGTAILSALFIVILVAIASTTMTLTLKNNLDATRLLFETTAFHTEGAAVRFWAMDFLSHPEINGFGHTPHQAIYTQNDIVFKALPHIRFSVQLIDLNAKFNINQLRYPTEKTMFYRLVKHLLEDKDDKKSYTLTQALTLWVSAYQPGHEKNHTTFIAHLPMVSLSELELIPEVSPKDLKKIFPYLTALPTKTTINLNTAPEELLMAMTHEKNNLAPMEALINARGQKGIAAVSDVLTILKQLGIKPDEVCTESTYFLNIGQITQDQKTGILYSLLKRVKNKEGTYTVHLIHETWNTN